MDNDDIIKVETEIEKIPIIIAKNIDECCLLIVKLGTEKCRATEKQTTDIQVKLSNMLKDVPGLKLIVSNMDVDIQKVSLPKLRQIQSSLINSASGNESVDEKKSHPLLETIELP